jgi:hypothetical protein
MSESASDEDRRIVNEMIGRFEAPSFIRRARLVETSWDALVERCTQERIQQLEFVRLRLGQLVALAGSWDAVGSLLANDDELNALRQLHDELQPRLRMPLVATTSQRILRGAARELIEAIDSFNRRWNSWLAKVDLEPINRARDSYNRFYLLERECALGSAVLARRAFRRLDPVTIDDLIARFPPLNVPLLK